MSILIVALCTAAGVVLAAITVLIRRDGGRPTPAAVLPAPTAVAVSADTDEIRRRLADDWRDQLALDPPELHHRHLIVRPYVSRHHEDTVEIRPAHWQPVIGAARVRAALDTETMPAVTADGWNSEGGTPMGPTPTKRAAELVKGDLVQVGHGDWRYVLATAPGPADVRIWWKCRERASVVAANKEMTLAQPLTEGMTR